MSDSADYRRFGAGFTGTRPSLSLGDPGIDETWLRRYRRGIALAVLWYVGVPLGCGIGLFGAWGPFGRLDAWQLETFGYNSAILLMIPFVPLAFAPLVVAHLRPIDVSRPFLLGIRQAFEPRWGPRVVGRPGSRLALVRRVRHAARATVAISAAIGVVFVWKAFHDASAPHAPLPEVSYAALAAGSGPLPHAVRVTDVAADRSLEWTRDYVVRRDSHREVYFALRPRDGDPAAPVALIERDDISLDYAASPGNSVDAPGPREGSPMAIDDWTAERLRRAGFMLASRTVVLRRRQLQGRDPEPDPLEDGIYALCAFAVLAAGAVNWFLFARVEAKLSGGSSASTTSVAERTRPPRRKNARRR